jgi:hypothetical protein
METETMVSRVKVKEVQVTTRLLGKSDQDEKFKLSEDAPLLEVLQEGSERAGVALLPDSERPLDRLHNLDKHGQPGPGVEDLGQALGEYLDDKERTRDLGIELVRAFRVNTRWAVATSERLTPREILDLPGINLSYTEYTL